jgi:hypothetical protein
MRKLSDRGSGLRTPSVDADTHIEIIDYCKAISDAYETASTLDKMSDTIAKMQNIIKHFKLPWLSVDVYTTEEGDVGVFEFQMEFAYEGFVNAGNKQLDNLADLLKRGIDYASNANSAN